MFCAHKTYLDAVDMGVQFRGFGSKAAANEILRWALDYKC